MGQRCAPGRSEIFLMSVLVQMTNLICPCLLCQKISEEAPLVTKQMPQRVCELLLLYLQFCTLVVASEAMNKAVTAQYDLKQIVV